MEKAIKLAIEGGYKDNAYCNEFDMYESSTSYCHSTVLIDPEFWKSLGKACGWGDFEACGSEYEKDYIYCTRCNWHRLIDALAAGKTPDEFFNNLIDK